MKRIEANRVTAWYGGFKAVEDVTLAIEPKHVTALIGPSGCGKSTFIRTLNRMPEVIPGARIDGEVLLDGEDIYAATALHRPGHRRRASGAADGRAVLRARPRVDPSDRGPHRRAQDQYTIVIVTHNMQQAARVSDSTAFFNLEVAGDPGRLVEVGLTSKIFTRPEDERTEAYITGRFG